MSAFLTFVQECFYCRRRSEPYEDINRPPKGWTTIWLGFRGRTTICQECKHKPRKERGREPTH